VPAVGAGEMASVPRGTPQTAPVRDRVARAYERQLERQGRANARVAPGDVERHCVRTRAAESVIAQALSRHSLSARGYHRVLKLARTIADLAGENAIDPLHMAEAVGYRRELG